ncbi:hypothetical protein M3201_07305 [Paenibacillus motobuensis]|uniref:hypothetical protein n=1 Tax=Paenibacillus TaxID=44249 RepID=UPI00203C262E|nr:MULTISPECIES: hypothetical protein [Paenibacillus]MCM3039505.1 hypothetical protein [Paenibacillus lutimineralis]MCM3646609.1 hypothetical protein [Paenibacillus motobuensis]
MKIRRLLRVGAFPIQSQFKDDADDKIAFLHDLRVQLNEKSKQAKNQYNYSKGNK